MSTDILWTIAEHWTLCNKFLWNLNQYINIFIDQNEIENDVCKMAAILSQSLCVQGNAAVAAYIFLVSAT